MKTFILSIFLLFFGQFFCGEELTFEDEVAFEVQSATGALAVPLESGEVTIDLPIFGSTKLEIGSDGSLSKTIPSTNKQLNVGPLIIQPSVLTLKPQGQISYIAPATFMGKRARVGLLELAPGKRVADKEYAVSSVRLGISLLEPLTLSLKGARAIELHTFYVLFEDSKSPLFSTRVDFFGTPTVVALTFPPDKMVGTFTIGNKNLYELFPELQNNLIGSVDIISAIATLTLTKSNQGYGDPVFELHGTADLTDLKATNDKAVKNVSLSSLVSKNQLSISSEVKKVSIPVVGTVDSALVSVAWDPIKKQWKSELAGHVDVKLKGVGTLPVTLASIIGSTGIEFKGSVDKSFKVAGVTVKSAEAAFNLVTNTIRIAGVGDILGEPAHIALVQFADGDVEVDANFVVKKTLKPFKKTNIPVVKDFALKNPVVKIEPQETGFDLLIQGEVNMFNIPLIGDIRVVSEDEQETLLGEVGLPHNWKISDGYPELKSTVFNDIVIKDLKVILAEDEFKDTITGVRYIPGVNFVGRLSIEGVLEPIAHIIQLPIGSELAVVFTVPEKNPLDTQLSIALPATIQLGSPNLVLTQVKMNIKALGGIGFSGTLKLKPSKKDDPLFFTAAFMAGPLDAKGSGSMAGMWQRPFGIPNIAFGDVAMQMQINYALFATTGLPAGVGLQGALDLGSTDVKLAANISITNPENTVFVGELNKLQLKDIVALVGKIFKKKISMNKLPNFAIRDVEVYMVPVATTIGTFFYDEGFTFKGHVEFNKFSMGGRFMIPLDDFSGLIGEGYATKINYGPLLITGAGLDNIYNTEDDGPAFSLKITETEQKFFLTGLIELEDVFKVNGEVLITLDALSFKVLAKIKDLYDLTMEGEGSIYSADLGVKINLIGSTQDFLKKYVVKKLPQAAAKGNRALDDAKDKVNKLQKEIDSTAKTLKSKKDSLQAEAKKAKKSVLKAITSSPKLAKLASEISGIEIKLASLKASMKSAKGVLTGLQQISMGSSIVVASTVEQLSKIVDIKKLYFEGSVHKIVKGKLPELNVKGMIFGKDFSFKIKDFDLDDIQHSLEKVGDQIVDLFT